MRLSGGEPVLGGWESLARGGRFTKVRTGAHLELQNGEALLH
jgi:hypothetical protein